MAPSLHTPILQHPITPIPLICSALNQRLRRLCKYHRRPSVSAISPDLQLAGEVRDDLAFVGDELDV